MKIPVSKLILAFLVVAALSRAQAEDVLGYINYRLYQGDNLIGNQLLANPDNTLNTLFSLYNSTPDIPDGATFMKWDDTGFLPASIFDADSGTWSINYTLELGEGGCLHTPDNFTNTFVGFVGPYLNLTGGPRQINWNPSYTDGLYLISCPTPFGNATFQEVVGRAPLLGEWVKRLDEATQTYTISTFNGSSWDNGTPILAVGEAAWFNLGPVVVPEPSVLALAGLGTIFFRLKRRR